MPIPADLRRQIARLEGHGEPAGDTSALTFGIAAIDGHLPWGGLPTGCLHEVQGPARGDGAAAAFCTVLLTRAARRRRQPIVWITAAETLYGPGLAAFGLNLADLLLVLARKSTDILWAAEEALRTHTVGAVIAEVAEIDLTASRRLQLAAETGHSFGLLLRPAARAPTASVTRWRIESRPSGFALPAYAVGAVRWRASLEHCRGGRPRSWELEWSDAAGHLAVAAALPDRPAVPVGGGAERTAIAMAG